MLNAFLQHSFSALIGFLGGLGALWAQHHFAWVPRKRIELRSKIFDDAMNALAMYETDALDAALQANSQAYSGGGLSPHVVLRLETRLLLERTRLQVNAFFPPSTAEAYDAALRADVSLKNIPNRDFAEKSDRAFKLMAKDLRLL
jgi:hypothetical protein